MLSKQTASRSIEDIAVIHTRDVVLSINKQCVNINKSALNAIVLYNIACFEDLSLLSISDCCSHSFEYF